MPEFHVNALKSNLGAYSRAYLFYVSFPLAPVNIVGGESKALYLVRSTTLPESTIDPIEVPWQGQMYKIGSTHTFSDWNCMFNLDNAGELRDEFEKWKNMVHNPETNMQGVPGEYFGQAKVQLLNIKGEPIYEYLLNNLWPTGIGALDLAYDSKEVAQFDVTFSYTWHTHKKL